MRLFTIVIGSLALAACGKPSPNGESGNAAAVAADASAEAGGVLDRSQKGKPAPDVAFKDPDGEDVTLAEFEGKPLLVNLWASWCVPCVKELPTLDALARTADATGLKIIAVSQDMAPQPSVVAFLAKHKIATLEPYHDPAMRLSGGLNAQILPTSILFDAAGNEVWRYVGDRDWTATDAATLLAEGGAKGR
ncbi:MAG: TlpA disulfide reductase family protein [Sphingomicrobium sp.]